MNRSATSLGIGDHADDSRKHGLIANRFLGWHPSAYVGMFGITDNPQDQSRKAGTRSIFASVGYGISPKVHLNLDYWFLQDTGKTFLDPDDLDTIDPPFGYAREEFAAAFRHGQLLGNEIDMTADILLSDAITLRLQGGVLLPGPFYEQIIARVAGDALGGQTIAWAANGGLRVRF